MSRTFALVSLLGSLLASAPAAACDCVRLDPKGPNFANDLDRIAKYYPIAAEGMIETDPGSRELRFRPTHENRGPGRSAYSLDLISDCSLGLNELRALAGKPVFLLLAGGPDRYEASRCVDLLGGEAEAAIRKRVTRSCRPR